MTGITRRTFIKSSAAAAAGLLIHCSLRHPFDLIIRNGLVLDGSGRKAEKCDIGIRGDQIVAMENLEQAQADQLIDATGLIVAPGFIDIHTHTDVELLVNPGAHSKICQGVTTEVAGNCGASPFPLNDIDFKNLDQKLFEKYGLRVHWKNIAEFYRALEQKKIAINYASFTGHGDLRAYVVGKNDVAPTTEQLAQMRRMLAESMENGSLGLSTGLEYAPGSYAKTDEIIALCKVVSKQQGVYATHLRNEDDRVEEAIEEALTICKKANVQLQISHLKACNQSNWHKVDNMLNQIQAAISDGLPVSADRYPYVAYGTGLSTFLPLWSRQGETKDVLARLQDNSLLPQIKKYAESRGRRIGGWDRVVISSCNLKKNKIWEGKSIFECAQSTGKSPFAFIRQLLIEEKTRAGIVGFAMSEENLQKVLTAPFIMIASDGSAVAPTGKLGTGKPHPRYYGTFPRVLGKYCRDENYFDLATAIKKMTSMPAQKIGLKKRGLLKKGNFADITIFDAAAVVDQATFAAPHQFPLGINYVLVNGKVTVKNGKHTGARSGRVLRHSE